MRTTIHTARTTGRWSFPTVMSAGLLACLVLGATPALAEPEAPAAAEPTETAKTAEPADKPATDAEPAGDEQPAAEGSTDDVLQLDDVAAPLEPVRKRSSREEDHVRALGLFAAGRVAEQKQDYETALRNYQRTFRFDSSALAALREIVPLAFNLGWQEEGVRYALLLAERDPADASLLRRLALYLTEDGETERALGLYEKALELEKQSGEKPTAETVAMWMEVGRLYFLAEKYEEASEYFARVSEALEDPKQFNLSSKVEAALLKRGDLTYQLFGEAFLEAGRIDEARAAFESAQKSKADEGRNLFNLARVDAANKRPAQALAKLEAYFAGHYTEQRTAPYELLAEQLEELGQDDQLLERLAALEAADPENVPLKYYLAKRYREAGEYDKAAPLFEKLIESREERPPVEAVRELVEVRHRQKDAAKLLDVLGKTIGRGRSLSPLGEAGDELLEDKDVARAVVAEAQRRLEAEPSEADYGQLMAAALVALGAEELDAAQKFFDAALALDEEDAAQARVGWGLELFMANQYGPAAKVFRQALEDEKLAENAALHYYLAGALEMSDHTDEAIAEARKAAELEKDSPRFASRAAWILFHAKRNEEARQEYMALIEKFDDNRESPDIRDVMRDTRLVLSNIAALEGNQEEAEEWLEQVLDEYPEDIGALNDLGYLWADGGKHLDLALSMIEEAVASEPANMAYRDSLGWVLFRLGRYDEAVAELKVAASADDPDGVILDHLAQALAQQGNAEQAIAYWQRAIAAFEEEGNAKMAGEAKARWEQFEAQAARQAAAPPAAEPAAPEETPPMDNTPEK